MKKVASILGISAISLAVALAPAFAQQTNPPAGSATVQPKADEKAKAAGKDEKTTSAKPGNEMKTGTAPSQAKPGMDVKTDKAGPTTKPDVRSETTPAKPGADVKAMNPSHRPDADVKGNAPAGKSETGVKKDDKAAPAKQGTEVKKGDQSSKSDVKASVKHARKSGHKTARLASAKTHRNHPVKHTSATTRVGNAAGPATGN